MHFIILKYENSFFKFHFFYSIQCIRGKSSPIPPLEKVFFPPNVKYVWAERIKNRVVFAKLGEKNAFRVNFYSKSIAKRWLNLLVNVGEGGGRVKS